MSQFLTYMEFASPPDTKKPTCFLEELSPPPPKKKQVDYVFLYCDFRKFLTYREFVFSINGIWVSFSRNCQQATFEAQNCFRGMANSFSRNGSLSESGIALNLPTKKPFFQGLKGVKTIQRFVGAICEPLFPSQYLVQTPALSSAEVDLFLL